ncbi:hypothetical protein [Bacillus sp. mrc49]|uniref:hypothetical protein n=1 Tax=Bacillus sp. mrc49 TaxID=2054913 RepID=UPI0012FD4978|nr:hypothetical protein [Bacillus sp. mrc49]
MTKKMRSFRLEEKVIEELSTLVVRFSSDGTKTDKTNVIEHLITKEYNKKPRKPKA